MTPTKKKSEVVVVVGFRFVLFIRYFIPLDFISFHSYFSVVLCKRVGVKL